MQQKTDQITILAQIPSQHIVDVKMHVIKREISIGCVRKYKYEEALLQTIMVVQIKEVQGNNIMTASKTSTGRYKFITYL